MNLLNSRIAYSVIKANNGEQSFSKLMIALRRYCVIHHIELNQDFSTLEEIRLFLKRHSHPNALKKELEETASPNSLDVIHQAICKNLGVDNIKADIQTCHYSHYNNAYILSNLRSLSTFITYQVFDIQHFPYQEDLLHALSRTGETKLLRDLAYITSKLGGYALYHPHSGIVLHNGENVTPFNLLPSEKQIWAVLYILVKNGSIDDRTLVIIDDIILPDAINLSFDVDFMS